MAAAMSTEIGFDYLETNSKNKHLKHDDVVINDGSEQMNEKSEGSWERLHQLGLEEDEQEDGDVDEGPCSSTACMMTPEPSDSSVIGDNNNTDIDPALVKDEDQEYDVESLVAIKYIRGHPYYLVKWKGYDEEENTWEPVRHLNCNSVLRRFHGVHGIPLPNQLRKRRRWKEPAPKKERKRPLTAAKAKQLATAKQKADLLTWQTKINIICQDPAPIYVLNDVDGEGPPDNFTFVNRYRPAPQIVISDDPPLHCACSDCARQPDSCCGANNDASVAYAATQCLVLNPGQPIFECNRNCHCDRDCTNRVVQHGRRIPVCIFRTSNECGWGVKALADIREGTFVMEYVGEVITSEEAERRGKYYDVNGRTYLFDLDFDDCENDCTYTVDAAFYGNVSHFVNHSCCPNLQTHCVWIDNLDPKMPRIALFSKRFIQAGEELTFDYMMSAGDKHNSGDTSKSGGGFTPRSHTNDTSQQKRKIINCRCGAPQCRTVLF